MRDAGEPSGSSLYITLLLLGKKKTPLLSHVVAYYSVLFRIDPIELNGLLLKRRKKKHPGHAFLLNSLHVYIIVEQLQAKLIKSKFDLSLESPKNV